MKARRLHKFKWCSQDNGSLWSQFELGGAPGILAIVKFANRFQTTAIVELPVTDAVQDAGDELITVEAWLLNVGAIPTKSSKVR